MLLCSKGHIEGEKTRIFALSAFLNQFYWFIVTVAGAITASELSFSYAGVEFSLVALFAVLGFEIKSRNVDFYLLELKKADFGVKNKRVKEKLESFKIRV